MRIAFVFEDCLDTYFQLNNLRKTLFLEEGNKIYIIAYSPKKEVEEILKQRGFGCLAVDDYLIDETDSMDILEKYCKEKLVDILVVPSDYVLDLNQGPLILNVNKF